MSDSSIVPMSQREYALRRGVSRAAVHRAIRDGRIETSADGTIDPDAADRLPEALEVRKVIKRHLAEIQALGILGNLPRIQTGPGRPTVEFYRNEDQCIAISQLSRGPEAAEVRIALRRLFRAYKDGKLAPAVSADVGIGQLCGEVHRIPST